MSSTMANETTSWNGVERRKVDERRSGADRRGAGRSDWERRSGEDRRGHPLYKVQVAS